MWPTREPAEGECIYREDPAKKYEVGSNVKKWITHPAYPGTPAKLFEILAELMRRSRNSPDSALRKLC